nr:putative molybdenum carrier protein [Legionella sp. MW5194]
MGIDIGGWCPKGGLDENNVNVLKQFPALKEAKISDPDERTKLNILVIPFGRESIQCHFSLNERICTVDAF